MGFNWGQRGFLSNFAKEAMIGLQLVPAENEKIL